MTSPDYERGVDAANRALDRTHLSAQDMLSQWELVAEAAHTRERTDRYHYAKGVVDTLREFIDDKGR